jgi:hypothetical protein
MASLVPTYKSIVAKYALVAILAQGDLQMTASGDIAVTPDGDLRFGNDKCNAMHRLVQRWCFNARVLERLFGLVTQESQRMQQAEAERNDIAGFVFTNRPLIEKFHTLADEIGAGEFGGAACAGAIMVVLSNMLQRYKDDLKATNPKWERIGPQFRGYSFGDVVVSAANNFRHHDEWARTRTPNSQQLKSITVIEAALNYKKVSPAPDVPWRRNACADLLPVIGGSDFATLEQGFFDFAKAMCV